MNLNNEKKKIGITGGIGSGKSTVTDHLREKGFVVIDADEVSRDVAEPGGIALQKLTEELGEGILLPDGNLDRARLAEIMFYDADLILVVNGIFHEEIKNRMDKLVDAEEGTVIISAPLLFETNMQKMCDETWLIIADEHIRATRAATRDNVDVSQVKARMAHQMTDEEKKELADIIIDNNGSVDELLKKIDELL